ASPTSSLRITLRAGLTGAPAIFNPDAPEGTPPLTIRSLCGWKAAQDLQTLLRALTYQEGSGVILRADEGSAVLLTERDSILTARITDATSVQRGIGSSQLP